MSSSRTRFFAVLAALGLVMGLSIVALVLRRATLVPQVEVERFPAPHVSVLGEVPDWSRLDRHQGSITRSDFERLITEIYTTGEDWRQWVELGEHDARIRMRGDDFYVLRFGEQNRPDPAARYWQSMDELPEAPVARPLAGLHIAIDPGHIGGAWAKLEERWLVVDGQPPICEGDMTLTVAKLLKPRLEGLGAKVSLVRERAEPVTSMRPSDLMELAQQSLGVADPHKVEKLAERLFYRTAEIRARARRVNQEIRPDLVLCLHFNADAWGDPEQPVLVENNHFHLLLHGAYDDGEVAYEDQRFTMVNKLLSRVHREEATLGEVMAEAFTMGTQMEPFHYPPNATNVRPVNGHSCLWARNLLANRLYDCPVIFLEPYVMNSQPDYPRMQLGDYPGLKDVGGKRQPSIFREYAELVIAGLVRHYGEWR